MNRKTNVFIFTGVSGAGKSVYLKMILDLFHEFLYPPISDTTRGPRESDALSVKKYNYDSPEEFQEMIDKNLLFEWEKNADGFYGTRKSEIEKAMGEGMDIILDFGVAGTVDLVRRQATGEEFFKNLNLVPIFFWREFCPTEDLEGEKGEVFFEYLTNLLQTDNPDYTPERILGRVKKAQKDLLFAKNNIEIFDLVENRTGNFDIAMSQLKPIFERYKRL